MNILSVRNLKKYYNTGENTVKALDGIDLDICKGEFLAVVGTSGSGKSTLLHMLGGLDNPTSGEVIIDGRNISGLSRDELTVYRRRKIGFVFPVIKTLLLFIAIIIVCVVTSLFVFSKSKSETIIELLRKDEA